MSPRQAFESGQGHVFVAHGDWQDVESSEGAPLGAHLTQL